MRNAQSLRLPVDVRAGLGQFAADELQYIVDDVCARLAGAPVDAVERELLSFQRARQLSPSGLRFLADGISKHARPAAHM
jgi:hypothetical protein